MNQESRHDTLLPASIVAAALIVAGAWVYTRGPQPTGRAPAPSAGNDRPTTGNLEMAVLPPDGVILPARWGDLGIRMASVGVIDPEKLEMLYAERGGMSDADRKLLSDTNNGNTRMTKENSSFLLNLFWALGLGNKNPILEAGPMSDSRYGGAEDFASTGGWTLAKGEATDHYSRHPFIILTPEQQSLVERVSKNIYRPCCNNSTHFPDCNHGMAMLGLLELMASQGVSEEEMYRTALQVNAYWFPDTYLTIARFLEANGITWKYADPREILGAEYSSASGYRRILSRTTAPQRESSTSCGA